MIYTQLKSGWTCSSGSVPVWVKTPSRHRLTAAFDTVDCEILYLQVGAAGGHHWISTPMVQVLPRTDISMATLIVLPAPLLPSPGGYRKAPFLDFPFLVPAATLGCFPETFPFIFTRMMWCILSSFSLTALLNSGAGRP